MGIQASDIIFEPLTANPSPLESGKLWFRSDLNAFFYYDGVTITQIDPTGGGGGSSLSARIVRGFSSSDNYQGSVDAMRGDVTGFSAFIAMRFLKEPSGNESIVGNYWTFSASGGWFLGVDLNRFKLGIANESNGAVQENFVNADVNEPMKFGRFYTWGFVFDGTDMAAYLNGELTYTYTPIDGYRPSEAGDRFWMGRNNNTGAPLPSSSVELLGMGYVADGSFTNEQVVDWHHSCIETATVEDPASVAFDHRYNIPTGAAPASLLDLNGSENLTLQGSLTTADVRPVF